MKYLFYSLALIIISVSFSCQDNDEFEVNTKIIEENNNSRNQLVALDHSAFENQLHWVSFLTAKAISSNHEAEVFFSDAFNLYAQDGTRVAKLSDLLESSTPASHNPFEQAFREQFAYYFNQNNSECSNGNIRSPRGGPTPPGVAGGCAQNFCMNFYYNRYLSFLLQDNCLEIYLPNGYDKNDDIIYTTAHPLNNYGENEAYTVPEQCLNIRINSINLSLFKNVILTRPYINSMQECSYTEFDYIYDFTEFLKN